MKFQWSNYIGCPVIHTKNILTYISEWLHQVFANNSIDALLKQKPVYSVFSCKQSPEVFIFTKYWLKF